MNSSTPVLPYFFSKIVETKLNHKHVSNESKDTKDTIRPQEGPQTLIYTQHYRNL